MIFLGFNMFFKDSAKIIKKRKRQNHCYSSKTPIHCSKIAFKTAPGRLNARFKKLREVICPILELREEKRTFVKVGEEK
jgi:hypothetical protein